jgi:biotin carboxylase
MDSQNVKLMVLGGSPFQVPLIEKAKEMGLYVIACDYLPSNPGHAIAHEFHNVSTTDKEAVLQVAQKCRINAITTFCSDPAVPAVAYVAGIMGLPGPNLYAVEQLTEKDKFRQLMKQAGLNIPACYTVKAGELPVGIDTERQYIVKPVDSSGSKGITKSSGERASLTTAIDYALSYSRAGRCIVESFIEGRQVHGDAFVQDGKIIYHYLGDHYFYTKTNSFIPISTRWPASVPDASMASVISQVEKVLKAAGYLAGPINIEARIDNHGEAYIIEVGPRNGGNYVPIIQHHLSGFDFTQAVIDMALGKATLSKPFDQYKVGAYYILHAEEEGFFTGVEVPDELKDYNFFMNTFKSVGDKVEPYKGSNETVGVLLFEYPSTMVRDTAMSADVLRKLLN